MASDLSFLETFLRLIVFFLAQMGWWSLLHFRFQVSHGFCAIAGICLQAHVLFLFSLAGGMSVGCWFVFGLGGVFLAWFLWRRPTGLSSFIGFETACFMVAVVFFIMKYWEASYVFHDEISYWGLLLKSFHLSGALPDLQSCIPHGTYPPHIPLWIHYFCTICGYSEGLTYAALATMSFACLLTFCSCSNADTGIKKALLVLGGYFLSIAIGATWQMLLIDKLIGFLWGSAAGAIILLEGLPLWVFLSVLLPFLSMTKPIVGIGFSFMMILALALRLIFREDAGVPKRRGWLGLCALILIALAPVLIWNGYCVEKKLTQLAPKKVSLETVKKSFSLEAPEVKKQIIQNFARSFLFSPTFLFRALPAFLVWLVLLECTFFLANQYENQRTERFLVSFLYSHGFLVYAGGLLFMYLFFFSDSEGLSLAQFERYLSSFLVGWALYNLFLLSGLSQTPGKRVWIALAVFVGLALAVGPRSAWAWWSAPPLGGRLEARQEIKRLFAEIPPDRRVYIVGEGLEMIRFRVLRFEIAPRPANPWGWMTKPDGAVADDYSLGLASFVADLGSYDHVLVEGEHLPFASGTNGLLEWATHGPARLRLFRVVASQHSPVVLQEEKRVP